MIDRCLSLLLSEGTSGKRTRSTRTALAALVSCVALQATISSEAIEAALVINLDFTNFSTGAPANGDPILGGGTVADAQSVIQTAASIWEQAFANSSSSIGWSTNVGGTLTQTIAVEWAPLSGSTLATGGTGWFSSDGRWSSGTLTWDNDGSSDFFVDATPTESSEWNKVSTRDLSFNGIAMNADRTSYDAAAGVARSNSDMLTVAIHEIGHALGFFDTFPAFAASDLGSDGDVDITGGPFTNAEIVYAGGHTTFQMLSPAGGDFPYDPGGGSFFPPANYYPNVMGSSILTGTRKRLTETDIAIVGQFLQFDMNHVDFDPQPVPEPSSLAVLALGSAALLGSRARQRRRDRKRRLRTGQA